jgi:predicted MFS family arabinose efflux permease
MRTSSISSTTQADVQASWIPMIVLACAQILMSFNVAALPVSIGPMVETFDTPSTTVGTAIVVYSLVVAAFIMLGAKIGQIFGGRTVFQVSATLFGLAMLLMTFSPTATVMLAAQCMAGASAAALVPTLVVLITANYQGKQQAQALGMLGSAQAFAGVSGFLVAGFLGTVVGWRYSFALLIPLAVIILLLSTKLKSVPRLTEVRIDAVGAILAAASIILLTLGFNNLNQWGLILAAPDAPFDLIGVSPAPIMIVIGVILGQAFFIWSRKREREQKSALLALEVLESSHERAAVISMFMVVALGSCINFLVPLYIQIVQGHSSLDSGIAMLPYNLTVFVAATLIVRLYERVKPRTIARISFALIAVGMLWLAFVIRNDWSTFPVMIGLIVVGLGQGSLVTLLFNVLVTESPKEFAGDVGSLRGTTNNLAVAVGTAIASALAVGLLSAIVMTRLAENPVIPAALQQEVDLDNISFVSNDRLEAALAQTGASQEQVAEAISINTDSRLRALKTAFLIFSGCALLAFFPAGRLPRYHPSDAPHYHRPEPSEDT